MRQIADIIEGAFGARCFDARGGSGGKSFDHAQTEP